MQVLVAPTAFKGTLRASAVAAAIGRGLERGGLEPPDLCPLADGGPGTIEVLLPRLGGETAAARVCDRQGRPVDVGFALLEGGAGALIELAACNRAPAADGAGRGDADPGLGTRGAGELILAAVEAGAEVVLVAAVAAIADDDGAGAIAAIRAAGGLQGARLVVLCDRARPGALAVGLQEAFGAVLRPGVQFVLDALDFDLRMRAARAVIVGEGRLGRSTLDGKIAGEVAVRARQAGVPAHAIVGVNHLDRFDARILDLQEILTASTPAEIAAGGTALARRL